MMKIVGKYIALILFPLFVLSPVTVSGIVHCSETQADCCCKPDPVSCCDTKEETSKINYQNPDCKCILTDGDELKNDKFSFLVIQKYNDSEILPAKVSNDKIAEVNNNYSIISKHSFVIFQPKLYILNSSLLN